MRETVPREELDKAYSTIATLTAMLDSEPSIIERLSEGEVRVTREEVVAAGKAEVRGEVPKAPYVKRSLSPANKMDGGIAGLYTASMSSGLCWRALAKRSKNSCMASAGTRTPMDSCGRQRLQYGSMNPIALCFAVDASAGRSWRHHPFLGVPKNDSATALPWQLPVRPMESLTPCAAAQAASSALACWLPRPLWNMTPPATYPRGWAIPGSAATRPAPMLSCMLQPTTMRVHRSMATARQMKPPVVLRLVKPDFRL
jgi:hypothetical protein